MHSQIGVGRHIIISYPSQGFDLLLLAPFLQHLTHLTFTCWRDLHPEALYMLAQLCPQLCVVLISNCELITSEDVARSAASESFVKPTALLSAFRSSWAATYTTRNHWLHIYYYLI